MKVVSSFTRGERYPAPDVARGLMLLLIALANVPVWTGAMTDGLGPDDQGAAAVGPDSVWLLVRTLVVDHRAYPLFAMLFGFGLATMISRRVSSGTQTYLEAATGGQPGLATPAQHAWAQEQATVDTRRLVRRRGWWMLLLGAVHGMFFPGDIIGAYGLAAVLFAGWLARRHRGRAVVVSVVIALLLAVSMLSLGWFMTSDLDPQAAQDATADASADPALATLWWPLENLLTWVGSTVATIAISLVVPAMFIGARLAGTDLLARPRRYTSRLLGIGVGGLALGALAALHGGLADLGWAAPSALDMAAAELFGLCGACGWLALLALYAGGPAPDGRLRGLRRAASAVGRRSMTAYLTQTLLFGLVLVVVPTLLGVEVSVGSAAAALVAVGVWLVTVVICLGLERCGRPGPFEVALRTVVVSSQRPRPVPPPPPGADQVLQAQGTVPQTLPGPGPFSTAPR